MRLQERPKFRSSAAVRFIDMYTASDAVRYLAQSGLNPANVRMLDENEAFFNGVGDGAQAVVVLAFESADHPVEALMARGLEICAQLGGVYDLDEVKNPQGHVSGIAGAWRNAFIKMPHFRDAAISCAVISDTFETAITWDKFRSFHENVKISTKQAIEEVTGIRGIVTCRFTHAYPDGAAPYYTFQAKGRHGGLLEQWRYIKQKASDAVIENGGTITHHHAVGRDHMVWYRRQRPDVFGLALQGAKEKLDPSKILNPGVIVD